MVRRMLIALTSLAVLAAACSGGDDGLETTTSSSSGDGLTTTAAGEAPGCESLLSLEEVEGLFGEAAAFDAEGSSGDNTRIMCSWTSVEDENTLETQLLFVQVYRGSEYYGPELVYPEAEEIDGIGEAAYLNVANASVNTGTRDGGWAIFVDYSVILGGSEDAVAAKRDQVIDLLRLVHDRVV